MLYIDIARMLIRRKCDVDAEAINGRTALHEAVWVRCASIIRMLIRAKCDIDPVDNKYYTPLMLCAEQGFDDIMLTLLKAGSAVERKNIPEGYTALHLAAQGGHLSCVKILLQHNAQLEAKDRWTESTPIAYSVGNGHLATCRYLMEQGANLLLKDRVGRSLLHVAVPTGNKELITLLLANGVPVNDVNQRKTTPLIEALKLYRPKRQIPRLLLKWGADHGVLTQQTIQSKFVHVTPLMYAIYRGMVEDAKLLHQVGGVIDLKEHEKYCFDIPAEMKDWLNSDIMKRPRSMMYLCRKFILNCIAPNRDRSQCVKDLPIPTSVQLYLSSIYTY